MRTLIQTIVMHNEMDDFVLDQFHEYFCSLKNIKSGRENKIFKIHNVTDKSFNIDYDIAAMEQQYANILKFAQGLATFDGTTEKIRDYFGKVLAQGGYDPKKIVITATKRSNY